MLELMAWNESWSTCDHSCCLPCLPLAGLPSCLPTRPSVIHLVPNTSDMTVPILASVISFSVQLRCSFPHFFFAFPVPSSVLSVTDLFFHPLLKAWCGYRLQRVGIMSHPSLTRSGMHRWTKAPTWTTPLSSSSSLLPSSSSCWHSQLALPATSISPDSSDSPQLGRAELPFPSLSSLLQGAGPFWSRYGHCRCGHPMRGCCRATQTTLLAAASAASPRAHRFQAFRPSRMIRLLHSSLACQKSAPSHLMMTMLAASPPVHRSQAFRPCRTIRPPHSPPACQKSAPSHSTMSMLTSTLAR